MGTKRKYTDEELIFILQEHYKATGSAVINQFTPKNNLPHFSSYLKRFGSWNNSKFLAGIPFEEKIGLNMTKDDLREVILNYYNKYNIVPKFSELDKIDGFPSIQMIYKHFGNYDSMLNYCGLVSKTVGSGKYKEEYLINEIKRFVSEFGRVPINKDFENLKGYPSRKTFSNHFGDFNTALREAGFKPTKLSESEYDKKYRNKEYLSNLILMFIDKNKKVPTLKEMIKEYNNHNLKLLYAQVYGSWNNALLDLNLELNQVSQYKDDFLESEFRRFIDLNGRIPVLHEFNGSEYPSFWCYQNRFGSWNKAIIAYGYIPNDDNRKFILDDGEICASSYEFDISTYLKSKEYNYDRNIKYNTFIDNYKGKMDCDYVINHNNKLWYVEMAGFLRGTDFKKWSQEEKNYYFKIKYKRKMLKRQQLNYVIIKANDIKEKSMDEIFSFLN